MLQSGKIELAGTARKLGVSEMTIRRDLRILEKQNCLIQIKGGALPIQAIGGTAPVPDPLLPVKNQLAEQLYERIFPCETLFLSTGSTVLRLATLIARRHTRPLTILTNSLSVASTLFRSKCRVILLGGEMRTSQMDLVGEAAERSLDSYHVQWLVTGCDGALAKWGFYTSDIRLAAFEKKSISIAERTAVITDSSKFSKKSFTRFATPKEIDLLITDTNIPQDELKHFQKYPELEIITVHI